MLWCNNAGLLGLIDRLAAGTLMQSGELPLNPLPEAVQWAEQNGSQEVPAFVWAGMGLSDVSHHLLSFPHLKLTCNMAIDRIFFPCAGQWLISHLDGDREKEQTAPSPS